jgi:hypothetical protein
MGHGISLLAVRPRSIYLLRMPVPLLQAEEQPQLLTRPERFGKLSAVIDSNPFSPEIVRTPLLLTLDARSFEALAGNARAEAEYLCQLCWTDAIEALWGWEGTPIVDGIPQTELGPIQRDTRTVRRIGEAKGGFIGGVHCWSQFSEWADRSGYAGDERDWFIYYASVNHFHSRSGRHYLVTADDRLLSESEADTGWFRRGQTDTRIRSVSATLFLSGLTMKAHGRVFYEAPQPGHTIYTSIQSMYEYLARDFIEPRRRLFEAMRRKGEDRQDFYRSDREALVEGVFDRLADILRARDHIALANAREQDVEALDEIRYDLRSMIASAAGAIDAISVLAHLAFPFEVENDTRISLRFRKFRACLRKKGACNIADTASALMPTMRFIWSLRNPVFHRQGLPGYTLHVLGSASLSQITLSPEQVDLLDKLCSGRKETADDWGLRNREVSGIEPSVEPWAFAQRLAAVSIAAIQQLTRTLADDCGASDLKVDWTDEERRAIRRFRWLSGFPLEGP